MRGFFARWWVWAGLIVGAVIWLGSVAGGIQALKDGWNWINPAAPLRAPELMNLDAHMGRKAGSIHKDGIDLIQPIAVIRNPNSAQMFVGYGVSNLVLGGSQNIPENEPMSTTAVPHGIGVEVPLPAVEVYIPQGERREGRLVTELKWGATRDKLDHSVTIKGSVAVDLQRGTPRLTWIPDDDSLQPIGMQRREVIRRLRETREQAVRNAQ